MKTTIFYFSGTGNCLKIARDLAKELPDAEALPIAAIKDDKLSVSGRIGLIFPVYAFNPPLIVNRFIDKLDIEKSAYIFAITSCAQVAGNTLNRIASQLKKKNSKLSAGFIVNMPSNYTPFGGAISTPEQEKLFAGEMVRIKEIASIVKVNGTHKIESSKLPLRLMGMFIGCFFESVTPNEDKHFYATDACNSCGTCQRVCPVGNITIIDKRPKWMHKCEQCFACLQWCPKEAIQYEKCTIGRKRYHNPYIKPDDLIYKEGKC